MDPRPDSQLSRARCTSRRTITSAAPTNSARRGVNNLIGRLRGSRNHNRCGRPFGNLRLQIFVAHSHIFSTDSDNIFNIKEKCLAGLVDRTNMPLFVDISDRPHSIASSTSLSGILARRRTGPLIFSI